MIEWITTLTRNTTFWYALSFVSFVLIVLKHAPRPLAAWLDKEVARVRDELEAAQQMRREAAALLDSAQQKREAALRESVALLERARQEAERLKDTAEKDLVARITRMQYQAQSRVAAIEAEILDDVRRAILERALARAESLIVTKMTDRERARLADEALGCVQALVRAHGDHVRAHGDHEKAA